MSRYWTLLVLLLVCGNARADIVYNLVSYPGDQGGWTLSGSITTDGTLGYLTATSPAFDVPAIKSWTWTASLGNNSVTFSSTDPSATLNLYGTLIATPTELLLPFPTLALQSTYNSEELWLYGETELLRWVRVNNNPPPIVSYGPPGYWEDYRASDGVYLWNNPSPSMGGGDPWLIAQVAQLPEPSGLVIAGLSTVVLLGYARHRGNRRS
jgi:hypothetical protein